MASRMLFFVGFFLQRDNRHFRVMAILLFYDLSNRIRVAVAIQNQQLNGLVGE